MTQLQVVVLYEKEKKMENNNNYTVSDYQKTDNNAEDLEKMERGDNGGMKKPYSKADLLEILPKHFKFYFKITRVLEPKNDVRKQLFKWINLIFIFVHAICFAANLTYSDGVVKPVVSLSSISSCIGNLGCIPILYGTYKYFDDAGEDFYNIWKYLLKEKQQSVDKLSIFFRKLIFFFAGSIMVLTVATILSTMQDDIPLWANIYTAVVWPLFALLMVYGYGNFYMFGICLIVCVSHAANTEIIKIRTNVIQKFSDYKEEGEKIILKKLANDFLRTSAKLSKVYKHIGKILSIFLVTIMFAILFPLADTVISIVQGQNVFIGQLIFLFGVYMPIQVYFAILLLSTSISPSNEYTVFIEQLQKPDILFTISRIYGSEAHGMLYFFTGLETSRKDVVWKIFGIPLTFAVYQKVIGSLVSIIILSMTFALRSSVTL